MMTSEADKECCHDDRFIPESFAILSPSFVVPSNFLNYRFSDMSFCSLKIEYFSVSIAYHQQRTIFRLNGIGHQLLGTNK